MIPKQLFAIYALICFLLQLPLPAKFCLEPCHSQGEHCQRAALTPPESSKCSHAQPISAAKITTKSGCACTMQSGPSATREVQFTLDSLRSERSKASGSDTELSSKVIPVLLEARLHGPPFSFTLDRQDTFLINSILRI